MMENLKSLQMIPNSDPFLTKQPQKDFSVLCAPVHGERIVGFTRRKPRADEVCFKEMKLDLHFPDPEGLLEYAFQDFMSFIKSANIRQKENGRRLCINQVAPTDNAEKFTLSVSEDRCVINIATTEGVRRALIFIEDEMKRRSGPFLPLGETVREPFVKARISRCFFTPPAHASAEGAKNELADDVDYYPAEYLNRLAHDGINGLWIGTTFRKLLKSAIIKEYGTEQDVQIRKLNAVIKKCKQFGIGIYLFVIEPASTYHNPALLRYPEMLGAPFGKDFHAACPSSPLTQAYIRESVTKLFTLAPELAGLIGITAGESISGCGSISELRCPRCKETFGSLAATMAATEKMISDAMKEVAPHAKFISWTYDHRSYDTKDVMESCALRDPAVIHLQNFEDLGRPVQLSKKRLALDYWLSFAGPGELMKATTKANQQYGKSTWAKIQACSSHEISTVPYVPVPGILYDKYKYMHENGIEGVMQCWYFGNYPSMMNKSASELSYAPFFRTKDEFLIHLAKTYFGKDYKEAVKAWKLFEKGYVHFPVNLAFEWVGPMQDSPCCPLHLLPVDHPMPGTWVNYEKSGGDRIGECLLNGHTIDEAIALVGTMNKFWQQGLKQIQSIETKDSYARIEQVSNATAIGLIFQSGYHVLRFYKLRHLLGTRQGDALEILRQMREIVLEEISVSTELLPITQKDNRIGYHSEANGYKIFPEKLAWRIEELKKLLDTEFTLVEKRIRDGLTPLDFYYGNADGYTKELIQSHADSPSFRTFTGYDGEKDLGTSARVYEDDNGVHIQIKVDHNDEITIKPEFNVMFPTVPLHVCGGKLEIKHSDGFSVPQDKVKAEMKKFQFSSVENGAEKIYTISFQRQTLGMAKDEPFRLAIYRNGKVGSTLVKATKYYDSQLLRSWLFPEHYCFFITQAAEKVNCNT